MPGKHSPSAQGYAERPFEAFVDRVNPNNEKITVDSAPGPDDVVVPYPMLSPNSWIRALPERGARVVTVNTAGGSLRRVVVGYFSRQAADMVTRYRGGVGLYRPLKAGEWDLMTPGVAYVHGTIQGKLYLRGGPLHQTFDPQKLHIRARAPTHRRELHEKQDGTILDEERLGVVVRNTNPPDKKHRWLRAPGTSKQEGESKDGKTINKQPFAKEYLRIFGRSENRLAALMEGDLFDDRGEELKQSKTQRKLRHLRELYDGDGNVVYQYEVDDEKGSIALAGEADRIDVTQQNASTIVEMTKMLVKLSQSLDIQCGTSSKILAQSTAQYGGNASTNLGPSMAPIDAVIKGTTFHASIMVPFFSALVGYFNAVAQIFLQMAKPETQGGLSTGPILGAALKPYLASIGATQQAMPASLSALSGLLMSTLSTNVKTSP